MSKPKRVLSFSQGRAVVESDGSRREVPSPVSLMKGDYVLCQAGVVVKKISKKQALGMLKEWREMNDFG